MAKKYFDVSEEMARVAKQLNSFSAYENGSATMIYRSQVDQVYNLVEEIKIKKPRLAEKAERMAERYSRKLAEYYNAYYRNEASCPSIMICGGGNFPTQKKVKQNKRRDTLMAQYTELRDYAEKIRHLLTQNQPILSGDADAIEQLEYKLETLTELQALMKAVNMHYRSKKTLDGCEELTPEQIERLKQDMERSYRYDNKPYPTWMLTNNSATIRATRQRLERLKAIKSAGSTETTNEFFTVIENTDTMRLQLIFDGKPEPEVREVLKKNAFKYSPKSVAWQRQLTNNARYALQSVIKELSNMAMANG